MTFKRHVPNLLTCGNVLCGGVGIISILQGFGEAAWFVWAACVFDFFDGFLARMLNAPSAIGKELDSLADVVSFGMLPTLCMYQLIAHANHGGWLPYTALGILVFSALRLAMFNIDERQHDYFIGLPTPANAIFITSLTFLPNVISVREQPYILSMIAVVFALLLVSPWKLMALKFKNFSWADNVFRFTFLALALLMLIGFGIGAVSLIIVIYILWSLLLKRKL